jgi:hypothetical protein
MPPTPPLPSDAENPSTPPTSPQRHQQAARNQERNQRNIGSPEQRRTPAIPSHPPAPPLRPNPVRAYGNELTHLPNDIYTRMIEDNVPLEHPILQRRQPRGPARDARPPPPPPPSSSAVGSSSVAPFALGSAFGPPLPPPAPFSRETLTPAQLRAAYVPAPVPIRSRGRPRVSCIFLKPFYQHN